MKKVCLIGAGNIGSRHLQGLKKIRFPLSIEVFDPSLESLETARQRYEQIDSEVKHEINFFQNMENIAKKIDLAIIATSSNIRKQVTEKLINNSSVEYLILEKILFQKEKDYNIIGELLKKKKIKTWINFSMRTVPFYRKLKEKFNGSKIQLVVSGSRYGLITNTVHFIDFITFLTDCSDFTVDTRSLISKLIESKRPGFLELNGTLNVYFKDGSFGSFTCYPTGDSPYIIEVLSENYRCISKESEKKAFISEPKNQWRWREINTDILYQSNMTNTVTEEIFKTGSCKLTTYSEASKTHLILLKALLKFINRSAIKKGTIYPFT